MGSTKDLLLPALAPPREVPSPLRLRGWPQASAPSMQPRLERLSLSAPSVCARVFLHPRPCRPRRVGLGLPPRVGLPPWRRPWRVGLGLLPQPRSHAELGSVGGSMMGVPSRTMASSLGFQLHPSNGHGSRLHSSRCPRRPRRPASTLAFHSREGRSAGEKHKGNKLQAEPLTAPSPRHLFSILLFPPESSQFRHSVTVSLSLFNNGCRGIVKMERGRRGEEQTIPCFGFGRPSSQLPFRSDVQLRLGRTSDSTVPPWIAPAPDSSAPSIRSCVGLGLARRPWPRASALASCLDFNLPRAREAQKYTH